MNSFNVLAMFMTSVNKPPYARLLKTAPLPPVTACPWLLCAIFVIKPNFLEHFPFIPVCVCACAHMCVSCSAPLSLCLVSSSHLVCFSLLPLAPFCTSSVPTCRGSFVILSHLALDGRHMPVCLLAHAPHSALLQFSFMCFFPAPAPKWSFLAVSSFAFMEASVANSAIVWLPAYLPRLLMTELIRR